MTEFEMASLQNDMLIALGAATQFYFALTTAFVVASYLAAHRLTPPMAIIVVSIFAFASAGNMLMMYRIMESLAGLAHEMRAFAQAGKGLAWHSWVSSSDWAFDNARYVGTALFLTASGASLYFFFHSRRVNRVADATLA